MLQRIHPGYDARAVGGFQILPIYPPCTMAMKLIIIWWTEATDSSAFVGAVCRHEGCADVNFEPPAGSGPVSPGMKAITTFPRPTTRSRLKLLEMWKGNSGHVETTFAFCVIPTDDDTTNT